MKKEDLIALNVGTVVFGAALTWRLRADNQLLWETNQSLVATNESLLSRNEMLDGLANGWYLRSEEWRELADSRGKQNNSLRIALEDSKRRELLKAEEVQAKDREIVASEERFAVQQSELADRDATIASLRSQLAERED